MQAIQVLEDVRVLVAGCVLLRHPQVALSVMRIVKAPIRHGRARHACAEDVGCGHRHQCHVAAVAPSHDADPSGVHESQTFQILDATELVLDFDFPELIREHGFELGAAKSGAAIVECEHDEAVLREYLSKIALRCPRAAHPLLAYVLSVRTAVGVDDDGISFRRIEGGRLEQAEVERLPIACLDRSVFLADVVLQEWVIRMRCIQCVAHEPVSHRAVELAQARGRRLVRCGVHIEVSAFVRQQRDIVPAGLLGDLVRLFRVLRDEGGAVQMPLERRRFVRKEVDRLRVLVHADEAGFLSIADDHPRTGRERPNQLAIAPI